MNFIDYFHITNKGITPRDSLPEQSYLAKSFYGYSLAVQIIYMLIFISLFSLTVFRSVKKIKNSKFNTKIDDMEHQVKQKRSETFEGKQTNDNLIYRFDQEDHEKQKKGEEGQEQVQSQKFQEDSEGQYQIQHDENQEKFLQLDHLVTFYQPFLIGIVINVNIFSCDLITIGCMVASIVFFLLFTVKQFCKSVKLLSMVFMIPSVLGFISIFSSDLDMAT